MLFLMKVEIPIDTGNEAIKDGTITEKLEAIIKDIKPEAVYFTTSEGMRAGYFFVEMNDPSEIPSMAEPFFLAFDAFVEFEPVMKPEHLAKAGPKINKIVKKYGG